MPKIKSPHIIVTEIEWDIDESDIEEYGCKPNLPNEVEIPMNVITDEISDDLLDTYADEISDYLSDACAFTADEISNYFSDTYGYTVKGFLIKKGT